MGRIKTVHVPEPCLYGGSHVQWFGCTLDSAAEALGITRASVAQLIMMGALKSDSSDDDKQRLVNVPYDDFAGNTGYGDYCRCVVKLL
jgi:hypothetical protein